MTAIGVCGFPRCGSSMTMRMLHVGGIDPTPRSAPESYELPEIERVNDVDLEAIDGHSVKLLDFICFGMPLRTDVAWRFIWLDRDPAEQTKSNMKLMRALAGPFADIDPRRLQRSYRRDRPTALAKLRGLGDVLVLSFESILADPFAAARALAAFVAPDWKLDPLAAGAVVKPRGPECAPELEPSQ